MTIDAAQRKRNNADPSHRRRWAADAQIRAAARAAGRKYGRMRDTREGLIRCTACGGLIWATDWPGHGEWCEGQAGIENAATGIQRDPRTLPSGSAGGVPEAPVQGVSGGAEPPRLGAPGAPNLETTELSRPKTLKSRTSLVSDHRKTGGHRKAPEGTKGNETKLTARNKAPAMTGQKRSKNG